MATPHEGPKQPSNTADPLFVRANLAVTDVSPAAGALPNDIARLKLCPKFGLGCFTAGGVETVWVRVLDVHPAPATATSTRTPKHAQSFLMDGLTGRMAQHQPGSDALLEIEESVDRDSRPNRSEHGDDQRKHGANDTNGYRTTNALVPMCRREQNQREGRAAPPPQQWFEKPNEVPAEKQLLRETRRHRYGRPPSQL